MSKQLDALIEEVLADPERLADVTGADDPLARAVELAAERGLDVSADEVVAAVERLDSLPDEVLALAAGGAGSTTEAEC